MFILAPLQVLPPPHPPAMCSFSHPRSPQPPPLSPHHKQISSPSPSLTFRSNVFLSSTSKSQSLDHTLKLFRLLPARDTVTWNTAISACLHHSRPDMALRLFHDMLLSSSSLPDFITIRSILTACSEANNAHALPHMHAYVLKIQEMFSSSESTILNTCLLNLYCRLGSTDLARRLFCEMPHKDVVAFTSMMLGYIEAGQHAEALQIFRDMVESDDVVINMHSCSCALHACAGGVSLFEGRQIHAHVIKWMMGSDVFVGTSLVDMYAKCDEMECVIRAFMEISEPNVVSWNALLAANLDGKECLHLFSQMRSSGVIPDHMTFACVLRACRYGVSICSIQQMHGLVVKTMGSELDVFVGSALFEMYVDQDCVHEAQKIFGEIEEKDDISFNLAIQGCIRNGHEEKALGLLVEAMTMGKEMTEATMASLLTGVGGLNQGKQLHALVTKFGCCDSSSGSTYIAGSLVSMYAEYHQLDDAIQLFEQIESPDLVLWTSLISDISQSGQNQVALDLYVKMVTGGLVEPPNHFTFSTVLSSCAHLIAVEEGKQIHAQIVKSDFNIKSDTFVTSGLVCMYAKCGYIEEASKLFDEMPERDLVSWNVMISSLAQHGFAERAIAIFEELLKQKYMEPNHITFLGVLSACSHCGLVEKGYEYFSIIKEPTISHYACLINLFGRAGKLHEAMYFVDKMPFEANELIWSSLLAACSIHGNVELGEYSAKQLLQLNPKDPGTYVALSNIYATAGRWKDMDRIRKLMEFQGAKKYPGSSWLNLSRKKHVFLVNDGS